MRRRSAAAQGATTLNRALDPEDQFDVQWSPLADQDLVSLDLRGLAVEAKEIASDRRL
jgi:hypothetical protein